MAVDDRNTTLIVSTPDSEDGKVYVYNRPTNALTYTLTQTIEPFKFGNDRQRFGAGLAISPDGEYLIVGSPNASNVKTKYSGAFQNAVDYPKNSIVGKDQGLWRAKIDIEGEEANIQFNSFSSVAENIVSAGLQNDNTNFIPTLLVGDYAIDPNNGFFLDTLGWVQYQRKDYKLAVFYLEKAVTLESNSSEIINHLGDAYLMLGRINEAKYEWEKALKYETDVNIITMIKEKINKYE